MLNIEMSQFCNFLLNFIDNACNQWIKIYDFSFDFYSKSLKLSIETLMKKISLVVTEKQESNIELILSHKKLSKFATIKIPMKVSKSMVFNQFLTYKCIALKHVLMGEQNL